MIMATEKIYQCHACGFAGPRDAMAEAKNVTQRIAPGETYTDRECPKCGALALPWAHRLAVDVPFENAAEWNHVMNWLESNIDDALQDYSEVSEYESDEVVVRKILESAKVPEEEIK
jgi:predicted RNA-binding Zn-ribbon protein involved in translation (DUF1610 family)